MMIAFMRALAHQGYQDVSPKDALTVVNFAIEELRDSECRIDLRVMNKALEDYRYWSDGNDTCHWQDLVRSFIKLFFASKARPHNRLEAKEQDMRIVEDLVKRYPDRKQSPQRNEEWEKQTGKSKDTLLRLKRDLKGQGTI